MLDQFRFMTDQESEKKIFNFWEDLEYIPKLKILLKFYPELNITKIESQGIKNLWGKIPLEEKKNIYQDQWKYQN
jgi:hypothetical protein